MTKTKFYLSLIALFLTVSLLPAQIHVDSTGSVGIGTDTLDANVKLHLTSNGLTESSQKIQYIEYTGGDENSHHYGIYSISKPNAGWGYGGYFEGGYVGVFSVAEIIGTGYRYGLKAYGKNGTSYNYGLYGWGFGSSSIKNYGVYASASGSSSSINYGIYAYSTGSTGVNYGIYARAYPESSPNYAGYFSGRVNVTGTLTVAGVGVTSDEKFKENFGNIDNAMSYVKKLAAKTYKFKEIKGLSLPKGKQFGFTAQDLENVLPELVKEVSYVVEEEPKNIDPENEDVNIPETQPTMMTYKAINYIELIPILTQAIQEQQAMIDDLKNRVDFLESK